MSQPISKVRVITLQKQPLEVFLKTSQNSQESTCFGVSFLIKIQAGGLQLYWKIDSNTGVFLWILRNFYEHLFYKTPQAAASSAISFCYDLRSLKQIYKPKRLKKVTFLFKQLSFSLSKAAFFFELHFLLFPTNTFKENLFEAMVSFFLIEIEFSKMMSSLLATDTCSSFNLRLAD